MIKHGVQRVINTLGFELRRIPAPKLPNGGTSAATTKPAKPPKPLPVMPIVMLPEPPVVEPVWPLPRRAGGPNDAEIRDAFARFDFWHYAYEFTGGLSFPARHTDQDAVADAPERPRQRFRHFMPHVVGAFGGTRSLQGKRVLDIACNSGFWSIQCALLGAAEVVGFDARQELIDQANLIKSITGADQARFQVLDFWNMSPESLGGTFDDGAIAAGPESPG